MRKSGFTMVELIIVVSVIAVLASIIIPRMTQARERSRLNACKVNLRHLEIAMKLYANDNNGQNSPNESSSYQINSSCFLYTEGYIKKIPVCPSAPPSTAWSYYISRGYLPYYIYCHPYWTPGGNQPTHPGVPAYRPCYRLDIGISEQF